MVGALHQTLSRNAARFLLRNGCELVANEFSTASNHCEGDHVFDAIGLDLRLNEVRVVEAKASRSDFRADDKIFDGSYAAVADRCYLICPEGMIRSDEVPRPWGLLYLCVDQSAIFYRDATKVRRQKLLVPTREFRDARQSLGGAYTHTRRVAEALVLVRRPSANQPTRPLSRDWPRLVRAVGRKLSRHYLGLPPDG